MKLTNHDLLEGVKSGLAISIRRGDLDLCKTCFDFLWSNQQHWLRWKIGAYVLESAYYLIGDTTVDDTENGWRRFCYALCLAPKTLDTVALAQVQNPTPAMQKLFDMELSPERVAGMNEYTQKSIAFISKRAGMGGLKQDIDLCYPASLLFFSRKVDKPDVDALIRQGVADWKLGNDRKPHTCDLPWYVFDPMTEAGKQVVNVFLKSNNTFSSPQQFTKAWIWAESYKITNLQKPHGKKVKIQDNQFFDCLMTEKLAISGIEDPLAYWNENIAVPLSGIVEWVVNKRGRGK